MGSKCYSPREAESLFEQHWSIRDRIAEFVDELNELEPALAQARAEGYQPRHETEDGFEPADFASDGEWDFRYVRGGRRDESYNGWKNYPTWAVNLWLSNDEGLYRAALEMARNEITIGDLAALYEAWITEDLAPDLGASFAADLLGYSLAQVDWREIAKTWRTDSTE